MMQLIMRQSCDNKNRIYSPKADPTEIWPR